MDYLIEGPLPQEFILRPAVIADGQDLNRPAPQAWGVNRRVRIERHQRRQIPQVTRSSRLGLQGAAQPVPEHHLGLPPEHLPGQPDIGLTGQGIVRAR